MQDYIKPMLPAELSRPFDNYEWIFEKNFGGFRAVTVKSQQSVSMYAGKHQLYNSEFPQLIRELRQLPSNFVLDGEIVMLNENGLPDLQKKSEAGRSPKITAKYFASDVISIEGHSLLKTPLIERKEFLKKLLKHDFRYIHISQFLHENGGELFRSAASDKIEGITAKKSQSLYYPGKVSPEWLKIRVRKSQEFYICGFTKPSGNNRHIGSIIAGYKENDIFCYSGHIAAGQDNLYVQELYMQLIPLITEKSPFETEIKSKKDIVWVHPVLKCNVKYIDLSKDHLMRQPVLVTAKDH